MPSQRQPAEIVVALDEDVEGAKLHLIVMLAGVRRVEVGDAIHAEHDGLAVEH
jgi:hypothetical protein